MAGRGSQIPNALREECPLIVANGDFWASDMPFSDANVPNFVDFPTPP
jgi:hypothetical protein